MYSLSVQKPSAILETVLIIIVAILVSLTMGISDAVRVLWINSLFLNTASVKMESIITSEERIQEVCDFEEFTANCPPNSVVHITNATFGHLYQGKCAPFDTDLFGCSADISNLVDERCSGNRQCQIEMPDSEIYKTKPCQLGLQVFLEISSICITGRPMRSLCQGISVTRSPYYFTSLAALRSPCASDSDESFTARLAAEAGLKISLLIVDPSQENHTDLIENYIEIYSNEVRIDLNITTTDQGTAEYNITSVGNKLTLKLFDTKPSKNIIIQFQATGCHDYRPPSTMWEERRGDEVTVGCYTSNQSWKLNCVGNKWIGSQGNCSINTTALPTTTIVPSVINKKADPYRPHLSKGVLLVTIIASTFLLCALVITAACVYVKCLKSKYQSKTNTKPRVQYALSPQDAAQLLGNGIQDGAQRNSWHNTMPLPQNNDQHGVARKDYMTMNVLPIS